MGGYFRKQLETLQAKHSSIREVRGMGLMLGLEIDSAETAKAALQQLLAGGILINRTHEKVLRFLPPYIIQKKHVDQVIHALDAALHFGNFEIAKTWRAASPRKGARHNEQPAT